MALVGLFVFFASFVGLVTAWGTSGDVPRAAPTAAPKVWAELPKTPTRQAITEFVRLMVEKPETVAIPDAAKVIAKALLILLEETPT